MDLNFKKVRSQLIASALILLPAILSILQSETGLALVYFSFFLVLYREGLPSSVLVIGFAISLLVVLTLLIEQNTLAIILTAIAIVFIYLSRKEIRRNRAVFFTIVGIWAICVGVQRFAVPYFFSNVLKPYQVQRIYATVGKDYQVDESTLSEADLKKMEEKKESW